MVRIGIIGIGFMGYTHFEGAKQLQGGKVTAICTRDGTKRAGDWTGIQGNFGPPAGHVDLSEVKTYRDYPDLLADSDVDLVDICLPTALHEQVALEAIKAGKATLVEKPIAIELEAADHMVQAAADAKQLLMVGQVLPYFPEFRFAAETIQNGGYGKLLAAHFKRIITPPNWSDDMSDYRRLGGWGIDLHIHDNHFIALTCGVPKQVFSRGIVRDGLVNHVHTLYVYDDPDLALSSVSGGIAADGLSFSHGFEIFLEKATVLFNAGTVAGEWVVDRPLTVITQDGKASTPQLEGATKWCAAFTAELQDAVDAVGSGQEARNLSGRLAREALKICYAEAESISSGRSVPLD